MFSISSSFSILPVPDELLEISLWEVLEELLLEELLELVFDVLLDVALDGVLLDVLFEALFWALVELLPVEFPELPVFEFVEVVSDELAVSLLYWWPFIYSVSSVTAHLSAGTEFIVLSES